MEKVVVSVDGSVGSRAAVDWCAQRLSPGTAVIAVCGISFLGEFAIGLPPFELSASRIGECAEAVWCEPLRAAGLRCTARLVHRRQVAALVEVSRREVADLLVVGRQSRHGLADMVIGKGFDHLVRRPPCPVMVVPDTAQAGADTSGADGGRPMKTAIVDVGDPETARRAWRWCAEHLAEGATIVVVAHPEGATGRAGSGRSNPSPTWEEAGLPPAGSTAAAGDGLAEGLRLLPIHGAATAAVVGADEPDVVVVGEAEHGPLTGLAHLVGGGRLVRLIDGADCPVVILPRADNLSSPGQSDHDQPPPDPPSTRLRRGTGARRGVVDADHARARTLA